MKRTKWIFAVMVMLALVVGIDVGNAQKYIPIGAIEGIDPPLPPREIETAEANSICFQVVNDHNKGILRPQIFAANGATAEGITQEMVKSLQTIQPEVKTAGKWQSFGFTCKPAGWKGFVDFSKNFKATASAPAPVATAAPAMAKAAAMVPLPKAEQAAPAMKTAEAPAPAKASSEPDVQTQLNAIRGKLGQLEQTPASPTPAKVASAKPATSAKKAAPAKPAAPCASKDDFNKLKEQVEALDKTLNGKEEGENSLVDKVDYYWATAHVSATMDENTKKYKVTGVGQEILDNWYAGKTVGFLTNKDLGNYAKKDDLTNAGAKTNGIVWALLALAIILGVAGTILGLKKKP